MPKRKSVLSFLLIVAMVFAIAMTALADGHISTGEIVTEDMPLGDDQTRGASAYGIAPSQYYPFIFDGTCPYAWEELDTTDCIVGRLYVHHRNDDIIIEISEAQVTTYTATQDALYYVTTDQHIVETNYFGTIHTTLYQTERTISDLDTYWHILYFLEDDAIVVLFDTETKATENVLTQDYIRWIYLYTPTQLVCETTEEDFIYLDISTGQITELGSMAEVNNCIAPFVTPETVESAAIVNGFPSGVVNDVTFPFADYPATAGYNANRVTNPAPLSYFSKCSKAGTSGHTCSYSNPDCARSYPTCDHDEKTPEIINNCAEYANAGWCLGFALYAHDVFMHVENWSRDPNTWAAADSYYTRYSFVSDEKCLEYFSGLQKGTYIRYGEAGDENIRDQDAEDGKHSAVFDRMDGNGVWVYEGNQDYHCGVFYQYYPVSVIRYRYAFPILTIKHRFLSEPDALSMSRHALYCDNCTGYLRESHTATATYTSHNNTQHRVSFSCCNGYVLQNHVTLSGPVGRCRVCDWIE